MEREIEEGMGKLKETLWKKEDNGEEDWNGWNSVYGNLGQQEKKSLHQDWNGWIKPLSIYYK